MSAVVTQPNFWDFYTVIFKKYRVKKTHVQITATNLGTVSTTIVLVPLGDTAIGTYTTLQGVREIPRAAEFSLAQAGSINSRIIHKKYDSSAMLEMLARSDAPSPPLLLY